jgi:hypothetical protein
MCAEIIHEKIRVLQNHKCLGLNIQSRKPETSIAVNHLTDTPEIYRARAEEGRFVRDIPAGIFLYLLP